MRARGISPRSPALDLSGHLRHPLRMIEEALARHAALVESVLAQVLTETPLDGEIARPERLMAAMRHGVLAGGKRLRPFLVIETARLFGVDPAEAVSAGAAVELIHCYSLVHDDLPAMDDDDIRRGKPTVHKAYDDATAILVGDALLTLAFDVMARPSTHPDAGVRAELVLTLARAAGLGGMVGGQLLDLAAEGRFGDGAPVPLADAEIRRLQAMKTGALIRVSCEAGAILGRAVSAERHALENYGRILGLAFQIADDLIDAEGDASAAGKATGKDAALGKGTLVSLMGASWARDELDRLVAAAGAALDHFGPRAETLKALAHFVAVRKH